MTKVKKKGLSEKFIKTSTKKQKINPFEVHVNRQKFDVLGRKSKNDRGLPGVARSKSIKKRKETLLQEYKIKDKTNRFLDRRIGEKNSAITEEDRIMARYTAERMKSHNKKTMFNLADDEVLTHRGQTLSEIERFDDPRSDDEEEDEFESKGGGLEAKFVGDAHFGGGIFREKEEGAKSRASLIEELIAESKKRKAERQRAKEQTLELTEKLDADWQELLPLVDSGKSDADNSDERPEKQSYDQLMRELKFESRGKPSDKLKSEDEVAKEEKEKLEKLEAERLKRMKGLDHGPVIVGDKHRSADDLDDGFDIESDFEEDGNIEEKVTAGQSESEEEEEDDESDDEGNEEEAEEEYADKDKRIVSDNENEEDQKSETSVAAEAIEDDINVNDDADANDEEVGPSSSSDDEDDLSDLKGSSDEEEDDQVNNKDVEVKMETCDKEISNKKLDTENFKENLKKKKQDMEKARNELPYTFKMPECYEEFQSLMTDYGPEHQGIIVERIIKCHHPSLGHNNNQKLESLFTFLLQHLSDAEYDVCWKILDCLAPYLFDLTQLLPTNSANSMLEVLAEKQSDFRENRKVFPETDTLVFLKLIPLLFPTSDERHQVVTPAIVFLCQMLNQCKVTGRRSIATGLFVVTILLEYTALSKRYCPEVVKFLKGILQMAIPREPVTIPNCKPGYHPLILDSAYGEVEPEEIRLSFNEMCSETKPIERDFQLQSIFTTLKLVKIAVHQYEDLPAFNIIFDPFSSLLQKLEDSKLTQAIKEVVKDLRISINKLTSRKMEFVVLEKKRPKALRLYEPMIEKVVDGKRRKIMSEEKAEQQKLLAKYKREMKGALREVRRDRSFLAKIKFRQQAKSDEERIRKVKQIYGWGAEQQGELNKLKRKKK